MAMASLHCVRPLFTSSLPWRRKPLPGLVIKGFHPATAVSWEGSDCSGKSRARSLLNSNKMKRSLEFRVYVGTYAKYNAGSIFGQWLDLSDYSDLTEFYQACLALHDDEESPELMFQDYENIPEMLISESWLDDNVYPYMEAVSDMDASRSAALEIYCTQIGGWLKRGDSIEELLEQFNDSYQGYFGGSMACAKEEFAYYLVEETGLLSGMPEILTRYFDYEAYGRDLFLDGYSEYDGHVFMDQ